MCISVSQSEPLYCAGSLSLFHSHTHTFTYSMPRYSRLFLSLFPSLSLSLIPSLSIIHTFMHSLFGVAYSLSVLLRLLDWSLPFVLFPLLVLPQCTDSSPSICQFLPLLFYFAPKCSSIQLSPVFFITLSHSLSFCLSLFHHIPASPPSHSLSLIILVTLSIERTHAHPMIWCPPLYLSLSHAYSGWIQATSLLLLCLWCWEVIIKINKDCLGFFHS